MSDQWRYACPECGSRQVSRKREGYRCDRNGCYATFEEPVDLTEEPPSHA